ncbi:MAG: ricin-type beta-trefoil lectin domain protein [Myxococcales bacterium]|nr:ricin-type beta-trefoil lectin domain protein [Myxococcales bacterium]MBP6843009.1 ricin-type beta-trefoil lectin domain protein [Kofleriaceae bacterium]
MTVLRLAVAFTLVATGCTSLDDPDADGDGPAAALTGGSPIVGLAGKCLDVRGRASIDGASVVMWSCGGQASQAWLASGATIRGLGDRCLAVDTTAAGVRWVQGRRVELRACTGAANQQWTVRADGAVVGYEGKCLDVAGSSTADDTIVVVWPCLGGANQRWRVTPPPPPPPPPPPSASAEAGKSHFIAYLTSDSAITPFVASPTAAQQAWMRAHYWRMFAFSPYFDSRLAWSSPAWVYKDSYAIYPTGDAATAVTLANAAQFVLKDRAGNRLFIPYACGGGTCSQYAADIGNPQFRALWIAQARAALAKGYRGLHVDDVNLDWRISNGAGAAVLPIDPRTGVEMTLANWRRYFAEFMEQVRTAFPGVEIVHNSLWWVSDADPFVARQLAAADLINIERGVNDSGITRGAGPFGFETLLAYVDRRHAAGTDVLYFAYGTTRAQCEYNLASYFLTSSGGDGTTCRYQESPGAWWAGYDVALGEPLGARVKLASGVMQREYRGGVALVNQPGSPSVTVTLARPYRTTTGALVSSVTLGPAAGAVLVIP